MLATLAAALLLPATLAAGSVPLARATREMVEVADGQELFRHEKGISPDDAGAVHAFLKRLGESRAEIVRVPGRAGTFLASDFCGSSGEDLGRCLVLVHAARGGVRELSRTPVVRGADGLHPVVFAGGGRTIVLAQLGAEYGRGLRVYELAGGSVALLGAIDAGTPGDLGPGDPTPHARLRLEGGTLVVRFDADLVLGAQEGAPVAPKPVEFRLREDGFVRAPGARRGRH